jgi:hypothetical protein
MRIERLPCSVAAGFGHQSIVTTERYERQRFETLREAAKKLDTGKTFKIPSSQESTVMQDTASFADDGNDNPLTIQ